MVGSTWMWAGEVHTGRLSGNEDEPEEDGGAVQMAGSTDRVQTAVASSEEGSRCGGKRREMGGRCVGGADSDGGGGWARMGQ